MGKGGKGGRKREGEKSKRYLGARVVDEDFGKVILKLGFEGLGMMKERTGRLSRKRQKYVLGDNKFMEIILEGVIRHRL